MLTAAEKILKKALVGSNLDSSQWNGIQAGLRDRAFFSSRVAEVTILDAAQQLSADYAEGGKDLSKIRMEMRDALTKVGYKPAPGTDGTIKDLYSKARLDVLIKHNVATARGFIQYAEANTPGAFAAFPAQEFKRVKSRKVERKTWPDRWRAAGGQFFGGRMIARKDDPVWAKLSVFGTPYPPFDWGSGMGVRDISRKEAIRLGVITDDEIKERVGKLREQRDKDELPSMNGNLMAKIPDLRRDSLCGKILIREFGDQIKIENSKVSFETNLIRDVISGKSKRVSFGECSNAFLEMAGNSLDEETVKEFVGKKIGFSNTFFIQHGGKHLDPNEPYAHLTEKEFELLPSLWRTPSRIVATRDPNRAQVELDTIDGGCLMAIIDCRNGLKSIQKRIPPGGIT